MNSLLKKVDNFGNKIRLTFENEVKHQTAAGGFITCLFGIVFAMAIYYFGKDIIER